MDGHHLVGGVYIRGSQGRCIGGVTIWSEECPPKGVKGGARR